MGTRIELSARAAWCLLLYRLIELGARACIVQLAWGERLQVPRYGNFNMESSLVDRSVPLIVRDGLEMVVSKRKVTLYTWSSLTRHLGSFYSMGMQLLE